MEPCQADFRSVIDLHEIEAVRRCDGPACLAVARLERRASRRAGLPSFLSSHPETEERVALARAGSSEPQARDDEEPQAEALQAPEPQKLVPERPKLAALEPVQREVLTLLERRDYAGLEALLGGRQRDFEKETAASSALPERGWITDWRNASSASPCSM